MKFLFIPTATAMVLLAGCFWHRPKAPAPVVAEPVYRNPYNSPLSTPGARFGVLPPVVQNTVRSEAGTAEIVDVRKETRAGRIFYKISFRDAGNFPPLFVAPDGSVLNPDLTVAVPAPQQFSSEVKMSELPSVVKQVIQEKAPTAEVTSINQEAWGEHIIYVVSFKDHPKLYIVADGTELIRVTK